MKAASATHLLNGKAALQTCNRQQTFSQLCWCSNLPLVHRASRHCKSLPNNSIGRGTVCSSLKNHSRSGGKKTGRSTSSDRTITSSSSSSINIIDQGGHSSKDITASIGSVSKSEQGLAHLHGAKDSADGGESLLQWHYTEDEPLPAGKDMRPGLSPAAQVSSSSLEGCTGAKKQQQRQRQAQRHQQQQQQQQPDKHNPRHQGPSRQQVVSDSVAKRTVHQPDKADLAHHKQRYDSRNAGSSRQPQQRPGREQSLAGGARAASGDNYLATQERVRNLLVSADLAAPEVTAGQLLDNVNDLIIALHMLATASKPKQRVSMEQYNTASAKLAAAIIAKFKALLLTQSRQQLIKSQQQQRQQKQKQKQHAIAESGVQADCTAYEEEHQQQQGTAAKLPAQLASPPQPAAVVGAASATTAADAGDMLHCQLVSSLRELPATRMAAAVFALGVLRQYDTQLVLALEAASGQLLCRSAFTANQLGQIAQGFTHLDHRPHPDWQQNFINSCQGHLSSMKGNQLASLAGLLMQLLRRASGTCTMDLLWHLLSCRRASRTGPLDSGSHEIAAPMAAAVDGWRCSSLVLQPAWVDTFLEAAGSQSSYLDCKQLSTLLQAAAVICYHQQQQQLQLQNDGSGAAAGLDSHLGLPVSLLHLPLPVTAVPFLPNSFAPASLSQASKRQDRTTGHDGCTSPKKSQGSQWLAELLMSFHQQLPNMQMQQLGIALPALAALTTHPWPHHLLEPVLLQVQLLLPASNGHDIVVAAAGVAQLAAPDMRSNQGTGVLQAGVTEAAWSDALLLRLHAVLPALSSSEIALVVATLAQLKVKPYKAWVYDLCARLRVEANSFSAGELVAVVEGLAVLKIALDPEVMHLFVLGIKRWLPVLGLEELDRLVLGVRKMYPKVLPGRTVHQLVDELERRSNFLQLQQS